MKVLRKLLIFMVMISLFLVVSCSNDKPTLDDGNNNQPPVLEPDKGEQKPPVVDPDKGEQKPPVVDPDKGEQKPPVVEPDKEDQKPPVVEPVLNEFTNVYMEDMNVSYDGNKHSLVVKGDLPLGTKITYSGNDQVNAGRYEVEAVLSCEGYKTKTIKAVLTISKVDMDIQFLDMTCVYDGQEKEITIIGNLPEGVSVYYENNKMTNAGTIVATAHFKSTNPNYNIPSMEATLTINKATVNMDGITFNDQTFNYDGIEKELLVSGTIPSVVEVKYENNKMTEIGEVIATANFILLDNNNYEQLFITSLSAKLTIVFKNPDLEYVDNGDNTITITKYNGKDKVLLIPEKVDGKTVVGISKECFIDNKNIFVLGIPKTVENLEASMFKGSRLNYVLCEAKIKPNSWNDYWNDQYDLRNHTIWNYKSYIRIEDDFVYSKDDNNNTAELLTYIGENKELNVPTTIGNYNVTKISYAAFEGCSSLTSITLPGTLGTIMGDKNDNAAAYGLKTCANLKEIILGEGITSIGEYAFSDCSSLTNITLPNSLTSVGRHAFSGCSSLTHIVIPDSVTSIGEYAFSDCSSLTSITLPGSLGTIIGGEYYNAAYGLKTCANLKEIILGEGITSIGEYAFKDCSSLTNITIPNTVTSIGNSVFSGCSSLTNITIPDSVTSIGEYAFSGCSSLISITLSRTLTSLGNSVFSGCSSLTSIVIPNSVTSIGNDAFSGCSSLTSIILPNTLTSLGYRVFKQCSSLTSITIPDSVTSIGNEAFWFCKSLTSITLPNTLTSLGYGAFGGCSSLTSITLPNSLTSIGPGAFGFCSSLTSITIPDSVTFIGRGAFKDSNIMYFVIPKSVVNVGPDAFASSLNEIILCEGITSPCSGYDTIICDYKNYLRKTNDFVIRKDETSKECEILQYLGTSTVLNVPKEILGYAVTSINSSLFNYYNFKGIILPDTIYKANLRSANKLNYILCEAKTNPGYELYNNIDITCFDYKNTIKFIDDYLINIIEGKNECKILAYLGNLSDLVIPSMLDQYEVTSIDIAFRFCSSLTSITIPNSVTSIGNNAFNNCSSLTSITLPNTLTSLGNSVFSGCSSLTSITIPDSVTSIGNNAFWGCSSLTSITLSNSLTSIGNRAFWDCSSLTSITLPNSVTSIGDDVFMFCSSLTSIKLPNSLTSIGNGVFRFCSSLTSIVIPDSVTSIGNNAFNNCSNLKFIYCEANSKPIGWHDSWYDTNAEIEIIWGYKKDVQ